MSHGFCESLTNDSMPTIENSSSSLRLARGKIRNCMDFIRFFQRITEKTVRYEASFFGRGMLHSLGVSLDQEITYNLPLSYRTGIRTVAGGVKSPPLTFWFASGKPLLLKAPSELRSAWEENFVAHGYRNMAIHGYTDVEIGTISVFGIYNYFVESGVDLRGLLESVAIATHSALHELPKTYEREFHAVDGKGVSRLTRREEEIIHWVSRGKTNADIALILGISSNTVRNHLHNASEKLSASNRMELVSRVGQNFSRQ